jgi:hypothetical protein
VTLLPLSMGASVETAGVMEPDSPLRKQARDARDAKERFTTP